MVSPLQQFSKDYGWLNILMLFCDDDLTQVDYVTNEIRILQFFYIQKYKITREKLLKKK